MRTVPLDRRTLIRGSVVAAVGALAGATAGCSSSPGSTPTTAPVWTSSSTTGGTPVPDPSRTLLAYFSRAGENYCNGGRRHLTVGNTEVIADQIRQRIGCDVYRIEPADPYPSSYDATVQRNVDEERADARPGMADVLPDLDGYDTVLVGSPVWNSRAPMIMTTFFEGLDLAGTTVLPFVTYAVSGLSGVPDAYAALAPGATIGDALAARGEEAAQAAPEVERWLRGVGLLG